MLEQQINLYRSFKVPKPALNFLSWKRFLSIQFAFIIFLSIIYLFSFWHIHHLKNKKLLLQTKLEKTQKEFFAIKKNYPQLFFSQDVGENVKLLQQDLEAQKKILSSLIMPMPFSQNLIAFATNIVPNVWLTNIALTESGSLIILKGKGTDMQALQKFFSNLLNNQLFTGFSLNVDEITRPEKVNNDNLTFQLSMKYKST